MEKLRLEDKLEYLLNFTSDLPIDDVRIPSMIIQPFIENAIKHGVVPLKHITGFIRINIAYTGYAVTCRIEDNGIGINASKINHQHLPYISMGSGITEKRIEAINDYKNDKIILEVKDKKELCPDEERTIVTITYLIRKQNGHQDSYYRG